MFWTNLQSPSQLHLALQQWQRPPGLLVQQHLDAGRTLLPQQATRQQRLPNYPCNKGGVVEALPTLVSYVGSNAYRGTRPGMLWDSALSRAVEPNSDERERLLGYSTGATAAPGLTEADRFQLTGRCMDANQMRAIGFTCVALDNLLPSILPYLTATKPQHVHPYHQGWGNGTDNTNIEARDALRHYRADLGPRARDFAKN
jgi:hypothetical protein